MKERTVKWFSLTLFSEHPISFSSPNSDWTWALGSESAQPLDHQEIPNLSFNGAVYQWEF